VKGVLKEAEFVDAVRKHLLRAITMSTGSVPEFESTKVPHLRRPRGRYCKFRRPQARAVEVQHAMHLPCSVRHCALAATRHKLPADLSVY
jgi:hypothetical protein